MARPYPLHNRSREEPTPPPTPVELEPVAQMLAEVTRFFPDYEDLQIVILPGKPRYGFREVVVARSNLWWASGFFHRLLGPHIKSDQIDQFIELPNITYFAFSHIFSCMFYRRMHELPYNDGLILQIVKAAEYLEVPIIKVQVMEFIEDLLDIPDTHLNSYEVFEFFVKFCDLCNHDDFLGLLGCAEEMILNCSYLWIGADASLKDLEFRGEQVTTQAIFNGFRW
ncbi:hypothetical protein TWF481_003186 [Arthrobotrys musiformis]|uniref:BTB domain-containing protein n=1 Tax=Arthrobotrys musiformis TaxID=47236 RepID=A0AAV9VPS8_9PEZI